MAKIPQIHKLVKITLRKIFRGFLVGLIWKVFV